MVLKTKEIYATKEEFDLLKEMVTTLHYDSIAMLERHRELLVENNQLQKLCINLSKSLDLNGDQVEILLNRVSKLTELNETSKKELVNQITDLRKHRANRRQIRTQKSMTVRS